MRRFFCQGASRLLPLLVLGILVHPVLLLSQDDTQGPSLKASLDRDSAKVGSVVALTLSYRLPEGADLVVPPDIKGLEGLASIDQETGPGMIKIRLLVDKLGSWKTGPLSLSYRDADGKPQVLTTDPVSLTVLSNLGESPDKAQLRPIYDIIPTKSVWVKFMPWTAGALGILLLGLGLVWFYRKRRVRRSSTFGEVPPHVRAKKEMEELDSQRLFEEGHIKLFYYRFSEILRRYLEDIRGFPAAEFTTQEIALRLDREGDRKLLPLLRHADLVKFADDLPTQANKEEAMKMALSFIAETSPVQETGSPANGSQGVAR
jgi:hypothetical protein